MDQVIIGGQSTDKKANKSVVQRDVRPKAYQPVGEGGHMIT